MEEKGRVQDGEQKEETEKEEWKLRWGMKGSTTAGLKSENVFSNQNSLAHKFQCEQVAEQAAWNQLRAEIADKLACPGGAVIRGSLPRKEEQAGSW